MNGQGLGPQAELMKIQATLFKKILKVTAAVEKIEKSGFNKNQNYHYSTEQDLINAVRDLLIKENLIILTDSETKEVVKLTKADGKGGSSEQLVTVVQTRHTFCDTETGATYPIVSTGAGWDSTDKGVYKGITGAMKYFVSKNFLVATEDDPENDGVTKPASAAVTTSPKSFSRSAPPAKVVAEAPPVKVEEAKVEQTPPPVVATVTQPKPSFGRRTVTKQEPNFP